MDINFSEPRQIKKSEHVLVKQLGETGVILNLADESYYGLDAIGYDFFEKITNGKNIAEAFHEILETYDVPKDELEQDLAELVESLLEANIITWWDV